MNISLNDNVFIRYSTINDEDIIRNLMLLSFGVRDESEPFENLDNRYLLLFKCGLLVAMSGITHNSEYKHLEIDWTCTHPEYRKRGYMQLLFKILLSRVDDDVYCSCWRDSDKDAPNLYSIMELFGFKEVVHSRVHWAVPHNCFRSENNKCIRYSGRGCNCYEDLYLLEKNKQCI